MKMNKLTTLVSATILAAAAGQASAALYTIAGTSSGGVNYAETGTATAGSGDLTAAWDTTAPGIPVFIGTNADAAVSFSGATVPVYVTGGEYDSDTGLGSWDLSIDLTGFGTGQVQLTITDQTFSLPADGSLGTLDAIVNCTGDFGGCLGIAPGFQGDFQAGAAVAAGANTVSFYSENLGGWVDFDITLTPEVPVPAAAWLFGSALLGLGGVARRRRA